MNYYYDLHIHTALSPCGDEDMTPNNIVNMSLLKGLDIIAITDHNSCKNAAACIQAAAGTNLLVVPGMELETSEEIHCVCLFPHLEWAMAFDAFVEHRLSGIKNRADIFGHQWIINAEDEITGEFDPLLITAAALDLSEAFSAVHAHHGVLFPAHVDRSANSIITNLGFMPPDLPFSFIEISKHSDPEGYMAENRRLFPGQYQILRNSDAHYLGDINEQLYSFSFKEKPDTQALINRLKNEE